MRPVEVERVDRDRGRVTILAEGVHLEFARTPQGVRCVSQSRDAARTYNTSLYRVSRPLFLLARRRAVAILGPC